MPKPILLLLACLVLCSATPQHAAAQNYLTDLNAFTDFTPGNVFEYELTDANYDSEFLWHIVTFTMIGDTLIEDVEVDRDRPDSLATVLMDLFTVRAYRPAAVPPVGMGLVEEFTCGSYPNTFSNGRWRGYATYPIAPPDTASTHPCTKSYRPYEWLPGTWASITQSPTTISIGTTTVDVDSTAYESGCSFGSGGAGACYKRNYAPGLGLYYEYFTEDAHVAYGGGNATSEYGLSYARVDSTIYGTPFEDRLTPYPAPTSDEEDAPPLPEAVLLVSVYPNPFTDGFRLRFNGGLAEPAAYEVVDLLGRRVRTGTLRRGTHEALIDLPQCAAGLYLVRVIEQGGNQHYAQALCRRP